MRDRAATEQFLVGAAAVALIALAWQLAPSNLAPFAPALLGAGVIMILLGARFPFLVCLIFVAFSNFRLHEAYPALIHLKVPFVFAVLTCAVLVWHIGFVRSIVPHWPAELKLFAIFFCIVSFTVLFALNRRTALDFWTATFWKIGLITIAVAWLPQRIADFTLATRILALGGLLIATKTIQNASAGVGLVELTRVTVSRDFGSILGDPNDLALVLLFPLAFAVAMVGFRGNPLERIFGLLSAGTILFAIVCTQSRGGLLGVVALFWVFARRFTKSKLLVLAVAVLVAVGLYHVMDVSDRISGGSAEPGLDESATTRLELWGAALRMALARPLTGVGLGNFAPSLYLFSDLHDMAAHSTWFGVLAESGVPGAAIFLLMIGAAFRSLARSNQLMRTERAPVALRAFGTALTAALLSFCVAGSFLAQGFTWPLYIILGLTAGLSRYVDGADPMALAFGPTAQLSRVRKLHHE